MTSNSNQRWYPLFLFNIYRLIVAIIFVGVVFIDIAPDFLGPFDSRLFLVTGWLYSSFAIFSIFTIQRHWPSFHLQIVIQILADILVIIILMHASGGVHSGLGVLLVVAIAGGSLISEGHTAGRTAFLFAAIASLGILIQVALADIYYWSAYVNYTYAGMLGMSFFATAFLTHTLARRVRNSEALAKKHGLDLLYMEQLNDQIVQNINSGIMVVDILRRILLFNETACKLLGLDKNINGCSLKSIAPKLTEQLTSWKQDGKLTSATFRPTNGTVDLIVTFTELKRGNTVNILIMLEDATLTTRRATQLKLASLGRLTASIAHEVRNPLGAISHAAQLLRESPHISTDNDTLIQIIDKNSQRVNKIIENVLQLSRNKSPNTENFDLAIWLQSYINEFIQQHFLTKSDIILQNFDTPLFVNFDQEQMFQIVDNLCENGLRYTQGTPLLKLTIGINSDCPYLDIRDYGQGMTDKTKNQIFEPFFTTESKGNGLGLYLAKEICEANQSFLNLYSNNNRGCCFRISFPKVTKN
ncbi:ATP-binding protein [Candidatus Halobeggiatoa sp. HSG11]|nr:ATP-binding protein [Candidatus Halobeggiatoa sp. HSG11]